MIVEYVRYQIPEDRQGAFEDGYAEAQSALLASPHCLAWELARCVEEPTAYTLRITWDSREGHERGFRQSPEFRLFLAAVRPFVDDIQEMRHYEVTRIAGTKAGG